MALDEIDKKLDVADSILTKLGILFKKHWGKILGILIAAFVYWFVIEVKDEMERDRIEEDRQMQVIDNYDDVYPSEQYKK